MRMSARNRFPGVITDIKIDGFDALPAALESLCRN